MQRLLRHPTTATTLVLALVSVALTTSARSADAAGPAAPEAAAAVADPRLEIAVTWDDPTHALPFPSAWVAQELEAQLRPLGILVRFHAARDFTVTPAETFRVILLERHPLERTQRSNAIGLAHREPSARAVWLLLRSTTRALGLSTNPATTPPPREQRLLARALARVAAHELVHTLAPGHPHAAAGLMQARLDRSALTRPHIDFDPTTSRVLLAALLADGLPGVRVVVGPAPPAPLAPPALAPLGTVY
jgi:hypothetical protein